MRENGREKKIMSFNEFSEGTRFYLQARATDIITRKLKTPCSKQAVTQTGIP